MRKIIFAIAFVLSAVYLPASIYEKQSGCNLQLPQNQILLKHYQQHNITLPPAASDAVFLRRVMLTAAGRLPTAEEVRDFINDDSSDKYSKLIDLVLDSPEYADMQTMRLADMLRIKSEFPINLWPNAVQFYHRQIHDDLLKDRSLKEMFYEMLTASGSNFRNAYANFFRASADRSPEGLARMVLLTTMNMRESAMSKHDFKQFSQLFSRIRYKSTYEWKEEIVYTDFVPAEINAILPDGTSVNINTASQDPRQVFADWLLDDQNDYFARAVTNRVWHWVFGRGIYPQTDDLPLLNKRSFWTKLFKCAADNAPTAQPFSAGLQDFLITEFKKSQYSLKHLFRLIMNSVPFHASSVQQDETMLNNFAVYPIRRLESELIIDALGSVTREYDRYMSVIPEPFTYLPYRSKAINIADGSISTGVLDNFGRPPRDSGQIAERNTASTDSQNLYLMNSATLYRRINNYCRNLKRLYPSNDARLEKIYLDILSRYPTSRERKLFTGYQQDLEKKSREAAWSDTVWVLFNSKEFLFYH